MKTYNIRCFNGRDFQVYTWFVEGFSGSFTIVGIRLHFVGNDLTYAEIFESKGYDNNSDIRVPDYSLMSEEELFQHSCTSDYDVELLSTMIKKAKEIQQNILAGNDTHFSERNIEL